jgi:HD-like signal output (HDOD) protein
MPVGVGELDETGQWQVRDDGLVARGRAAEVMPTPTLGSLIDRDDLLAVANALPPLPPVERRLARILACPDDAVNAAALAECISHDPVLAVAILRQANVVDLDTALMVIGRDDAIQIARRSLAFANCTPSTGASYGSIGDDLWRHSVMAKVAAGVVLEATAVADAGETLSAALVHDIGKLLLCRYLTPNIVHLLRLAAETDGFTEFEAELEVLQSHHGEVGGVVLAAWGFSVRTLLVVQHHHNPDIGFDPACYVVALADVVAHDLTSGVALGIDAGSSVHDGGLDDDDCRARQRRDLLAELEIDEDQYQAIVGSTAARFALLARRFAMG